MADPNSLQSVVAHARWVADARELLERVPELQSHGLPTEPWAVGTHGKQLVAPLTGIVSMAGPILETLEQARTTDVASFVNASTEVVESDALVARLILALEDAGSEHSHRVVMGVAHLSALLLHGRAPKGVEPAVARRASDLASAVAGMEPMARAELYAGMSSALSARTAAALSRSARTSNPLTAVLLANQLVWVMPQDVFDAERELGMAARIVGVELEGRVVTMVSQIARHALKESTARRGGRKERPADGMLEQLERSARSDALLHPATGPAFIRLLPHLCEARALKGVVDDHKLAGRYLEPNAIRTVSGAWAELLRKLGVWDALTAVMSGIHFVDFGGGLFRLDGQVLESSARWSLRIPRADPRMAHAVVACRFSGLVGAGGAQPLIRRALRARWSAMVPRNAVGCMMADHGVAAFQRASDALRFALLLSAEFVGRNGRLEVDGIPVAVAPGSRVAVGVSHGQVVGGTDGVASTLDGPAVSEAVHLCGRGAPTSLMFDPLQVRQAGAGEWGLMSNGVCCSRPAAMAAWNDWGGAVHRFGDGSEVCGLRRDFQTYPVDGWGQLSDGAALFVSLGAARGAPVLEVLGLDHTMLRELQSRDIQLTEGDDILDDEDPIVEFTEEDDPFGFDASEESSADSRGIAAQWTDIGFGDDNDSER